MKTGSVAVALAAALFAGTGAAAEGAAFARLPSRRGRVEAAALARLAAASAAHARRRAAIQLIARWRLGREC